MNLNKLFRSFKQKLVWEAFARAFLLSQIPGAAGVFAVSLVYHIMIEETPLKLALVIGGGIFSLSFVLLFLIGYPSKKKVAARIDGLGLAERASTMLELRGEHSEMAELQRADAVDKIRSVSSKRLKLSLLRGELLTCIVSVCLAVTMMILPYNIFALGAAEGVSNAEQEQFIKDLIAQLREEVKNSALDDELKDSLGEIVDQLEEDLNNTDSELQQAAEIEQAKREMASLLENALTKNKIGEALQKYELTRVLGEAVSAGNADGVIKALDGLEESLAADAALVSTLAEAVASALESSGVEETDELYTAFGDFPAALSAIDVSADYTDDLAASFDTAEEAIIAALENQAAIEAELDKLEDAMNDAKDEVLGNEKTEPESEMPEGEMPEGEMPEGEMPEGEMPEGGMPEGEMPEGMGGEGFGEGDGDTMTEGIYDPISGNVTYGEVFAAYYAEYLAALEAGEVPEDLQEIMDEYFSSLS